MKHIYKYLVLFFISISISACSVPDNLKNIVEETIDGVVVVYSTKTVGDKEARGLGTGFFIDNNVIITNEHVVNGATFIYVKNSKSNKKYKAKVIASDISSDIAIVAINEWNLYKNEEKWKKLFFSPSENLKLGQRIWAFGHPWGLEYSVSRGIISALNRRIDQTPQYFIQVDAKIYQGNSGGPLLDYNGRVIGMNSRMLARPGGSYGFSLTGDFVQKVIRQLTKFNSVYWFKLGISLKEKEDGDLYVLNIMPESPASIYGLEKGDRLVRIISSYSSATNGKILNMTDVLINLSMLEKDEVFWVEVMRKGKLKTIPFVAQFEEKSIDLK